MVLFMVYRYLSFSFLVIVLLFTTLYVLGAGVNLTVGNHTVLLGFEPHGDIKVWSDSGQRQEPNERGDNYNTTSAPGNKETVSLQAPSANPDRKSIDSPELINATIIYLPEKSHTVPVQAPKKASPKRKLPVKSKASMAKPALKTKPAPKAQNVIAMRAATNQNQAPAERCVPQQNVVLIQSPAPQPRVVHVQQPIAIARPIPIHHHPYVSYPRPVQIQAHVSFSRHTHRHRHASHLRHGHRHTTHHRHSHGRRHASWNRHGHRHRQHR